MQKKLLVNELLIKNMSLLISAYETKHAFETYNSLVQEFQMQIRNSAHGKKRFINKLVKHQHPNDDVFL